MQNGPHGTSGTGGTPHGIPIDPIGKKKNNEFIKNDPTLDDEPKSDREKEIESSPEDYKPFNVDAVEKLKHSKQEE